MIDCSPEGHQPDVPTAIFQAVQQPVCIVLAAQEARQGQPSKPATVHFHRLPKGKREFKFEALTKLTLSDPDWVSCPSDWRDPFLPAATGAWAMFPELTDLFVYNGSGVMPGRTWIIAPDAISLSHRWSLLVQGKGSSAARIAVSSTPKGATRPFQRSQGWVCQGTSTGRSRSRATTALLSLQHAMLFDHLTGSGSFPTSRLINRPQSGSLERALLPTNVSNSLGANGASLRTSDNIYVANPRP